VWGGEAEELASAISRRADRGRAAAGISKIHFNSKKKAPLLHAVLV